MTRQTMNALIQLTYLHQYGSSIPPNELGRNIGFKILNIENLNEILNSYEYMS